MVEDRDDNGILTDGKEEYGREASVTESSGASIPGSGNCMILTIRSYVASVKPIKICKYSTLIDDRLSGYCTENDTCRNRIKHKSKMRQIPCETNRAYLYSLVLDRHTVRPVIDRFLYWMGLRPRNRYTYVD